MANVIFNLKDCLGNPYYGKITLTPENIITGSNNSIIVKDSITSTVDNNGYSTFDNVVGNTYLVNVIANRNNNEFTILVPDTTGSYNASDLVVDTTSPID